MDIVISHEFYGQIITISIICCINNPIYYMYLDQTLFSFALALLKDSQREILSLGFEGVLQFFRATLPRKYLKNSACLNLVDMATNSMRVMKQCLFAILSCYSQFLYGSYGWYYSSVHLIAILLY